MNKLLIFFYYYFLFFVPVTIPNREVSENVTEADLFLIPETYQAYANL